MFETDNLSVEVNGDNIVVSVPGTGHQVTYARLLALCPVGPSPPWMAIVIFGAIYLVAASYLTVIGLAVDDRARAFKFAWDAATAWDHLWLLVGFVALQVWNDLDRTKLADATEAYRKSERPIAHNPAPFECCPGFRLSRFARKCRPEGSRRC
jgi:hypothetical protein